MRAELIIVEDFYEHPDRVRRYAQRQRYYHPYQSDDEIRAGRVHPKWLTSWFRDAQECPFKSSNLLIEALSQATGETVDREHWAQSFPTTNDGKAAADCESQDRGCLWNCSFHLKPLTGQRLGEGVHNHVTDIWNSVGYDGWTGIIYLNPDAPPDGGLKRWRNRNPARNYDWMTASDNWEMLDDIGNVFNRLILSRGNIPHSGAAGWGESRADARLFQTFFFQTMDPAHRAGLDLALED